ncbi:MAG: hypothetical protein ACOH13_07185 [Flavobacteriales bacterium]
MEEKKAKQLQAMGVVFTGCGVTFLAVGLSTHLLVFTTLGPSLLALGIVFLAYTRIRKK